MNETSTLREKIIELTREYYQETLKQKCEFKPGNRVPYAGRLYDEEEMTNLVDSALEFWLTAGHYSNHFEKGLAEFLNLKYCSLVNSGSSANLIAFMTLTSPLLENQRILPGDEVITVAAGFPTTVAPIIQYGAIPVFIDVTIPGYNIDNSMLEAALTKRTKAVVLAHTLGNPFDLTVIKLFCDKYNLWLIEDNCDSLGSKFFIDGQWKYTGTIGDIGTSSFYPPHHITMGEGGAVYTNDSLLYKIMNSLRDWGRDCVCPPGKDNHCGHRFDKQFGELPSGYDHKYVYSHFGYNLKATDMQAAIGCAQLKKLPDFINARKKNWNMLRIGLEGLSNILILPQATTNSDPSWFGFLITIKENADFSRDEIVRYLENNNIQTRNLFAGNLIKHPCFNEMRASGKGYRVVGNLDNTDLIMKNSFWIGVYPGLSIDMVNYMIEKIKEFVNLSLSHK